MSQRKQQQQRGILSVKRQNGVGKRGSGHRRKMRHKNGPYDTYIKRMCRSLNVPLPKRDVMRMLNQSLDLVMVGCMKSTHHLMRAKKITPSLAKRGIMSFFRARSVKPESIKMVLKMCDDTHKLLKE